jgi:hypothetical protein
MKVFIVSKYHIYNGNDDPVAVFYSFGEAIKMAAHLQKSWNEESKITFQVFEREVRDEFDPDQFVTYW